MLQITIFAWVIFLFVHSLFLTKLPIFEDEAQYLLLAESIAQSPAENLFIYLHNGLLPIFGWLVAVGTFFYSDSLVVGRAINVVVASTLIFWTYSLGRLYSLPLVFYFFAYILVIVSPILRLNTSVTLLDVGVTVLTCWYLYFTLKALKFSRYLFVKSRLNYVGLFLSVSGGLLTKATSALGIFVAIPLVVIHLLQAKEGALQTSLRICGIYVLSILVFLAFYLSYVRQINTDSGSSLITNLDWQDVVNQLKQNIWLTAHWARVYYAPFILVIPAYFVFAKRVKKSKFYFFLILWVLTTLVLMILLNRFYYPRHILLINLPLIAITAGILSEIPRKVGILVFTLIIVSHFTLIRDLFVLDPQAHIALEDRFEYYENYTSGKNLDLIAQEIKTISEGKESTVWLDGSYVMEYGLRREFKGESYIDFRSFRLGDKFYLPHSPEAVAKDKSKNTYVVVNRWTPSNLSELSLEKEFPVSFRHSQYLYKFQAD